MPALCCEMLVQTNNTHISFWETKSSRFQCFLLCSDLEKLYKSVVWSAIRMPLQMNYTSLSSLFISSSLVIMCLIQLVKLVKCSWLTQIISNMWIHVMWKDSNNQWKCIWTWKHSCLKVFYKRLRVSVWFSSVMFCHLVADLFNRLD